MFVLSAILAGVPVLMLTLFFGGVDLRFIASGYALTVGTAILSAAIGVSARATPGFADRGSRGPTPNPAILVFGVLPAVRALSPFAMLSYTGWTSRTTPRSCRWRAGSATRWGKWSSRGCCWSRPRAAAEARPDCRAGGPTGIPGPPRARPA